MVRSSGELPEEVVEEIFSWLPPKSLIRFKCVSKSWSALINSLLNDPKFVSKHLQNAKTNIFSPTSVIFQLLSFAPEKFILLNLQNPDGIDTEEFDVVPMIQADFEVLDVYSCDGIVCLVNNDSVLLCNPALRQSRLLVEPIDEILMAGFGYDTVSNDYKVVRIVNEGLVQVYSMSSDRWREIDVELNVELDSLPERMELHHNGVCYWLFEDDEEAMISFDLRSEGFALVKLPPGGRDDWALGVWLDSLAFVSWFDESSRIEVWAMDEDGSSNWIKRVTVGPVEGIFGLLGLWRGEELLMQAGKTGTELVSYDLRNKTRTDLGVPGMHTTYCWGIYFRTLISVNKPL